jgi:hypothetical protein
MEQRRLAEIVLTLHPTHLYNPSKFNLMTSLHIESVMGYNNHNRKDSLETEDMG